VTKHHSQVADLFV